MIVGGIDPGNIKSAVVIYDSEKEEILYKIKDDNDKINNDLLRLLAAYSCNKWCIEQIASLGMAVGESVFETCWWSGRFYQTLASYKLDTYRLKRGQIKMHLCNSMRAKDGNIRQALIDRLGAPGTKKNPGATYGVSKDIWAALAVAVTYSDLF